MEVRIDNPDLQLLIDTNCDGKYGDDVVAGYRKVRNFILSAVSEQDFRSMRSLKFENLKGKRKHEYSFRITKKWRLIVQIKKREDGNLIVFKNIEDYHK